MKVLMIGNTATIGWNITQGLRELGVDVVFVGNDSICTSGKYDFRLSWKDFLQRNYGRNEFDIIHIHSPNFKKLGVSWRYLTGLGIFFSNAKLVCHWHGSDLRIFRKTFPVKKLLKKIADYHFYSTIDLAWWLRDIPSNKKMRLVSPVDVNLFKPDNNHKSALNIMSDGAKTSNPILHTDMPKHLSRFKYLRVSPAYGLSEKLLQVTMLEGASCGVNVLNHSWLNRDWVIRNASIESQSKKVLNVYKKVMEI